MTATQPTEAEVVLLDLLRERTEVQRLVRPLIDRIENLNLRIRAAIAAQEAERKP